VPKDLEGWKPQGLRVAGAAAAGDTAATGDAATGEAAADGDGAAPTVAGLACGGPGWPARWLPLAGGDGSSRLGRRSGGWRRRGRGGRQPWPAPGWLTPVRGGAAAPSFLTQEGDAGGRGWRMIGASARSRRRPRQTVRLRLRRKISIGDSFADWHPARAFLRSVLGQIPQSGRVSRSGRHVPRAAAVVLGGAGSVARLAPRRTLDAHANRVIVRATLPSRSAVLATTSQVWERLAARSSHVLLGPMSEGRGLRLQRPWITPSSALRAR